MTAAPIDLDQLEQQLSDPRSLHVLLQVAPELLRLGVPVAAQG